MKMISLCLNQKSVPSMCQVFGTNFLLDVSIPCAFIKKSLCQRQGAKVNKVYAITTPFRGWGLMA